MRKTIILLSLLILDIYGFCWAAPSPRQVVGSYAVSYKFQTSGQTFVDTIVIKGMTSDRAYFLGTIQGPNIPLWGVANPDYVCMSTVATREVAFSYCFNYKVKSNKKAEVIGTFLDAQGNFRNLPITATVRKSRLSSASMPVEQILPDLESGIGQSSREEALRAAILERMRSAHDESGHR